MALQVDEMPIAVHHEPAGAAPSRTEPGQGKRWMWVPAAVAGVALIGAGAAVQKAEPPPDRPSTDMTVDHDTSIGVKQGAPQWKFIRLATVGAVGTHMTDTVPARISIDETLASKIGVPVAGRVTSVMVELGDMVRAGQPLFSLASPEIAQLRGEREQALVALEAARTTTARVEATVASRALPMKDLVAAKQHQRETELAVQLADQKLASVRVAPGANHEVVVTAPRAGVVVEKNVLVNQQVGSDAAAALLTVADLSSVWAIADVFEGQSLDIRAGGKAEVTTPSLPGVTLQGTVLMVSSIGDPERHTLPVRVKLANPDFRLRPNVYARVRFIVQHQDATLEIPATALVSDGEKQYVYVQDSPGHFSRRDIVAGSVHEGRLPVLSGLKDGETIVEQGAILLDNQIAIVTQ